MVNTAIKPVIAVDLEIERWALDSSNIDEFGNIGHSKGWKHPKTSSPCPPPTSRLASRARTVSSSTPSLPHPSARESARHWSGRTRPTPSRSGTVHHPPIPPAANPRGELRLSSRVDRAFRDGYERYANFERKRAAQAQCEQARAQRWGASVSAITGGTSVGGVVALAPRASTSAIVSRDRTPPVAAARIMRENERCAPRSRSDAASRRRLYPTENLR
ncbi:hypothetical protein C8J57DRAFT_1535760 [Mycena rebaudengoi]|nr:hypothetical protein C8J57DRAFT_1535760 [Mycena rebaudengoi]